MTALQSYTIFTYNLLYIFYSFPLTYVNIKIGK